MSLNKKIREAVTEVDVVKINGPHSKYNTWRGKYYRALQLLYEVENVLDPNYPSFTVEDVQKAYMAGSRIDTNLSLERNFRLHLKKEYGLIYPEDLFNELNSW